MQPGFSDEELARKTAQVWKYQHLYIDAMTDNWTFVVLGDLKTGKSSLVETGFLGKPFDEVGFIKHRARLRTGA
ncbi:hypothetical protein CC1G_15514 [Coprinopsis cinerea okayama7|uniref:Uncharacterized protein n=1 Tax=Coprinopsis cinerea (strain Okayama-7 / 130 / ATCC MYA-4618 / FGSC 9003) TaxID=240176 RepID=D6RN95_COPC7|nr:hypothetical protein CC1G_15514 [Coprinopsis cinerea okayama7\|eukprot:XP_002910973.1 hypothetical protein CC1G_15514 [Coprinopsis cinerea okayama7\